MADELPTGLRALALEVLDQELSNFNSQIKKRMLDILVQAYSLPPEHARLQGLKPSSATDGNPNSEQPDRVSMDSAVSVPGAVQTEVSNSAKQEPTQLSLLTGPTAAREESNRSTQVVHTGNGLHSHQDTSVLPKAAQPATKGTNVSRFRKLNLAEHYAVTSGIPFDVFDSAAHGDTEATSLKKGLTKFRRTVTPNATPQDTPAQVRKRSTSEFAPVRREMRKRSFSEVPKARNRGQFSKQPSNSKPSQIPRASSKHPEDDGSCASPVEVPSSAVLSVKADGGTDHPDSDARDKLASTPTVADADSPEPPRVKHNSPQPLEHRPEPARASIEVVVASDRPTEPGFTPDPAQGRHSDASLLPDPVDGTLVTNSRRPQQAVASVNLEPGHFQPDNIQEETPVVREGFVEDKGTSDVDAHVDTHAEGEGVAGSHGPGGSEKKPSKHRRRNSITVMVDKVQTAAQSAWQKTNAIVSKVTILKKFQTLQSQSFSKKGSVGVDEVLRGFRQTMAPTEDAADTDDDSFRLSAFEAVDEEESEELNRLARSVYQGGLTRSVTFPPRRRRRIGLVNQEAFQQHSEMMPLSTTFWSGLKRHNDAMRRWNEQVWSYLPLNPYGLTRRSWDFGILAMIVYCAYQIPYRLALQPAAAVDRGFEMFDWVVLAVFSVDILLNFATAYETVDMGSRRLVTDFKKIAWRYSTTWLVLDLLATLPIGTILDVAGADTEGMGALRLGKVARMMRLLRLIKISHRLDSIMNPTFVRLAKLLCFMTLVSHWSSCALIVMAGETSSPDRWLGIDDFSDQDHLLQYGVALYWTFGTMLGNFSYPQDAQTVYFTIAVLSMGIVVFSSVFGSLVTLVANMDSASIEYREKMDKTSNYLRKLKVPMALQQRIVSHFEQMYETTHGVEVQSFLESLPRHLRQEVAIFINRGVLESMDIFNNCSISFLTAILTQLRLQMFLEGDLVYCEGEIGEDMYFVINGELKVWKQGEFVRTLSPGDFFGSFGLKKVRQQHAFAAHLTKVRQSSVRAVKCCTLYSLSVEHYRVVAEAYPEDSEWFEQCEENVDIT